MNGITPAVKHLIIANVIFFLIANAVPAFAESASLWFPLNENYRYWQILTHMFMHANLTHIFFNMFALYSFGIYLETIWGTNKFLLFYFVCGIGACLMHIGVNFYNLNSIIKMLQDRGFDSVEVLKLIKEGRYDTSWGLNNVELDKLVGTFWGQVVGASGAIYGVLVAFAMSFPEAELGIMFLPIGFKAKYFVPFIVVMDLLSGFTGFSIFGGNIAHFAHVGGALFGFLMVIYYRKNRYKF